MTFIEWFSFPGMTLCSTNPWDGVWQPGRQRGQSLLCDTAGKNCFSIAKGNSFGNIKAQARRDR